VNAIQGNPDIANFELRVENTWMGGAHNRSRIQGFYGACQEDTSRKTPFVIDNDEPPVLLGNNLGANPAEALLHGLVGCMTTTMVLLAAAHGIEVSRVTSRIAGNIDLRGFLGLDPEVDKGYGQIHVSYNIEGVSEEEKQELIGFARRSPMYNTLINPVEVVLSLE
jgi:uncharacterized OsmC-like protein